MRFHKLEEFVVRNPIPDFVRQRTFLSRIRESQKFFVGDGGGLPEIRSDYFNSDTFPRLPYETCAFEFTNDGDGRQWGSIVIAWESPGLMEFVHFHRLPQSDSWCFAGHAELSKDENAIAYYPDGIINKLREGLSKDDMKLYIEFFQWQVAKFLSVLNCVNVKTEIIEAPVALNRKRQKSGKPPIYSYKTLVLRPSAAQRSDQGGTHESPRIHLRRGHIKHRRTGDFWWQPHVVGDRARGIVMKDYRADKLVALN